MTSDKAEQTSVEEVIRKLGMAQAIFLLLLSNNIKVICLTGEAWLEAAFQGAIEIVRSAVKTTAAGAQNAYQYIIH